MPWWIWLVLVIWMLVVLAAGGWYVFSRVRAAAHQLSAGSEDIGKRVQTISAVQSRPVEPAGKPPLLVRPLNDAIERYADAHAEVRVRRAHAQDRHMDRWREWERFNK